MEAITLREKNGTCYMGFDWRGGSDNRLATLLRANDILMFCDLRQAVLDDISLPGIEFFGCRLDGTSFRRANLHGARFIGCFSQREPTDFHSSIWQDAYAAECHLNVSKYTPQVPGFCCWPAEVVEGAKKTLAELGEVRRDAAIELGKLDNPVVAPYLASLLVDREWKVRQATLLALAQLHHQEFRYREQALLKWMFLRLGDKHPRVRHTARRLIKSLQPSNDVLLLSLSRMKAESSEDKLAGLYTAIELCKLNENRSDLWDISTVQRLLSDVDPKVRQTSLYLLEIVSEPSTQEWILKKLSDPVATVRAQAIRAIGWLAGAASATHILPLLSDPNDEVRIEALYTLRNIRRLKFEHISQALANYSAEVLRVTQELLQEMSKEPSYGH